MIYISSDWREGVGSLLAVPFFGGGGSSVQFLFLRFEVCLPGGMIRVVVVGGDCALGLRGAYYNCIIFFSSSSRGCSFARSFW